MFLTHLSIRYLLLFCVLLLAARLHAADWPRWGGREDCNMMSEEKGLPESFLPGNKSPRAPAST